MQKKIIIFGAGYHGRNALRACNRKKIYKVLCFVDNNNKIHNTKILNKKVLSPKILKYLDFDKVIITGRYIPTIVDQLGNQKIDKSKYLFWGKKEIKLNKKELDLRSKDCLVGLNEIIKKFNFYKIKFWIDLGSLLFLSRNQDMAEVSDIDLAIDYKDLLKVKEVCKKINEENNRYIIKKNEKVYFSQLLRKNLTQYVVIKKAKNFKYEPAIFELNLLVMKGHKTENLAKKKLFDSIFWTNEVYKSYKGLRLLIPYKTSKYLSKLYGRDWRRKKEFFYL